VCTSKSLIFRKRSYFDLVLVASHSASPETFDAIYLELKAHKILPNIKTFRILIRYYAGRKNRSIPKVFAIIREMKSLGFPIDVFICNSLIEIYAKTGDHKSIRLVCQHMVELGIDWNITTVRKLIDFSSSKDFSETVHSKVEVGIMPEMEELFPNLNKPQF